MRYQSVNELTKKFVLVLSFDKNNITLSLFNFVKVMFGQAMKDINNGYFVSSPLIFIRGYKFRSPPNCVFPVIRKLPDCSQILTGLKCDLQ